MNVFRAWSSSAVTSVGSGATDSVPVSMRPASSRSLIRPSIWSACPSMIRKNWRTSAASNRREAPSAVAAEPLIAASGARSSWLTMLRNSARIRSRSSSGAKSCIVTTTDSTSPSAERMGVALTSVFTRRPSGTESAISSPTTTVGPPRTRIVLDARVASLTSRVLAEPSGCLPRRP